MSEDRWFGSDGRKVFCEEMGNIPGWKRLLLCFLHPRKWRIARSYGCAAVYASNTLGDYVLFDRLVKISDEIWADIFFGPEDRDKDQKYQYQFHD